MADLFIDAAALARTQDRLRAVEDLLTRPSREMGALPSEAVGQEILRSKLRDFGDEWSYGIGKLGEFSVGAAEAIAQVQEAFRSLDDELKATLDQARNQA